jgi:acetyl esterase/lipase
MKTSLLLSLLLLSGIILLSCKKHVQTHTFHIVRDISYGPDTANKLDLFLPDNRDENAPLVIVIHGGGWVTGSKHNAGSFAESFARSGIVAANINYRYPDDYTGIHFKEVLDDIGAAARFLSDSSTVYHLRKSGFCLFGHSSGAHLSLLYAYRNNQAGLIGKAIAYDPVTDFTDRSPDSSPGMAALIRRVVGDSSEHAYKDASPLYHLNSSSVPALCLHGTRDDVFPYRQSVRLIRVLDSLNIPCGLVLLQNSPHLNNQDFQRVMAESVAFIKR